ncbi:hypothetical protein ACVWZM_007871 [Bradyrhizobium sp. USDA 4501]
MRRRAAWAAFGLLTLVSPTQFGQDEIGDFIHRDHALIHVQTKTLGLSEKIPEASHMRARIPLAGARINDAAINYDAEKVSLEVRGGESQLGSPLSDFVRSESPSYGGIHDVVTRENDEPRPVRPRPYPFAEFILSFDRISPIWFDHYMELGVECWSPSNVYRLSAQGQLEAPIVKDGKREFPRTFWF